MIFLVIWISFFCSTIKESKELTYIKIMFGEIPLRNDCSMFFFFFSNDDWLSSPSPGSVPSSAPPLSPSPGSQGQNFNTNLSNGYSSPMSTGSYDPYSPNGKIGKSHFNNLLNIIS